MPHPKTMPEDLRRELDGLLKKEKAGLAQDEAAKLKDRLDDERRAYEHEDFAHEAEERELHPKEWEKADQRRDRQWLELIRQLWEQPALHTELMEVDEGGDGDAVAVKGRREKRDRVLARVALHQMHVKRDDDGIQDWNDNKNVEIYVVDDPAKVPLNYDSNYYRDPPAGKPDRPEKLYRVIPRPPVGMTEKEKSLAMLSLPSYVREMRKMYGALTGAV